MHHLSMPIAGPKLGVLNQLDHGLAHRLVRLIVHLGIESEFLARDESRPVQAYRGRDGAALAAQATE